MIFANYYRDQARSLSHYENFRPYHESFYRFVEPTSITPYTYHARLRALHAALVITLRHACPFLLPNKAAGEFDPMNDCVRAILETFKRRCKSADTERGYETIAHIDRLAAEWQAEIARCKVDGIQLDYQAPDRDKATDRLLYNHHDRIKGLWFRHNDDDCGRSGQVCIYVDAILLMQSLRWIWINNLKCLS